MHGNNSKIALSSELIWCVHVSKYVLIISMIWGVGLVSSCTQVVTHPMKAVIDLGSDSVRIESTSVHNIKSNHQEILD